jgi:hypothetical protein
MVIQSLQQDQNADKSKLMSVEWAYMALLENSHEVSAKTLNAAIANDPQLFCEIIRTIFRSDREMESDQRPEPTEEQRAIARNAYRLLDSWRTVPGADATGSISAGSLASWIDMVKDSLKASGHLDVGLLKAGGVFVHSPADPGGLWMHRVIADVLNRDDMGELRKGYSTAVYNSRGTHWVDPTGAPEKQLAENYARRADEVENAGFHRLASTMRGLSATYHREYEARIREAG